MITVRILVSSLLVSSILAGNAHAQDARRTDRVAAVQDCEANVRGRIIDGQYFAAYAVAGSDMVNVLGTAQARFEFWKCMNFYGWAPPQ